MWHSRYLVSPLLVAALCSPICCQEVLPAKPGEHASAVALRSNPLRSRADVERAVMDLVAPLRSCRVPNGFHVGETATSYEQPTAHLEAWARTLWGVVPLAEGGGGFPYWEEYRRVLVTGSGDGADAWGLAGAGWDQRMVEMAAIALGLLATPEQLWTPLNDMQRDRLVVWLRAIERGHTLNNNWIYFRILVHVALERLGRPYDKAMHAADLAAVDALYLGDGWYSDGPDIQRDYYVAMAMHYYGLIYARFAADLDPDRCARIKARAARFAASYQHWFTSAGDALPYGRSMTYRFAQGAFWSAMAWAGVEAEGLSRGQVKGLLMRHLRWWFQQPMLDHGGILTIGYGYPNLMMSEFYNAPGSPYWALKSFLVLGLKADDPFWSLPEEPLPTRSSIVVQAPAGLILQHDDARNHVVALASGQQYRYMPVPSGNKYGKCAYSNVFGFSVLGAEGGLGGAGHDSTLALSEDGLHYRSRESFASTVVRGHVLASRWHPWKDVTVETWLAPWGVGHVRLHHVVTPRPLEVGDTGFSAPYEARDPVAEIRQNTVLVRSPVGISAVRDMTGTATMRAVVMRPNLNIRHARAAFPVAQHALPAGSSWIATAVVGIPGTSAEGEAAAMLAGVMWEPHGGPEGVPALTADGKIIVAAEPIPEQAQLIPVGASHQDP